jgi:predicted lipid-binding transport protein (Tim44 family)
MNLRFFQLRTRRARLLATMLTLLTALAFAATVADARVGGGGSRGGRTFSAPPVTRTAPNAAAPLQRTITQPGNPSGGFGRSATAPSTGSFFGRPGFLGGMAAGFLGAGLFGLLFGHGLFGGLGGFASIFGLLLQIVIVVVVARLAWGWWQRRNQPAYASGDPSSYNYARTDYGAGSAGAAAGGSAAAGEDIEIGKDDYDAFERLLGEVQTAYGREDLDALRRLATPEMVSYFSEDLANNASQGVVNRVSDVKLVQGDLSEAWREGSVEYATVAMTFSLIDQMVERSSGRVVDGDPTHPIEVTELWTFRRAHGGQWLLSAVQQT